MFGSLARIRGRLRSSRTTICKSVTARALTLFSLYDRLVTERLGGPAGRAYLVQHGSYAAQAQKLLGPEIVDANYPMDHTHTAPFLADVVRLSSLSICVDPLLTIQQHSKAFALGLKCGTSPLANLIVNATARMEASLGPCIPANATLPI